MSGVSDSENKSVVAQWIKDIGPKTVVDVGAGMGIYSIIAKQPEQYWTAVEAFAPYVDMFNLNSRYDRVIVADIRYVDWAKVGMSDLVILADMLEHMTKDEAKEVIVRASHSSRNILICFPIIHNDQGPGHEGNTFETHVDHWDYEEMEEFIKEKYLTIANVIRGDVLAYFMVEAL